MISDLQPDSALLAIALSAAHIASIYKNAAPSMKIMGMECERIVADYGKMWLRNAQNKDLDATEILDALVHTPEDLDSLAELLEMNAAILKPVDREGHALCDILFIQCKAQALIAEEFVAAANAALDATMHTGLYTAANAGNVIPFRMPVTA
jgi:hypothetical protein